MLAMIFNCMGMMLCVPFLTLYERKILSYSQGRKGPKKISLNGLLQPMVDGMKLVIKESGFTFFSKKILFILSPIAVFFFSLGSLMVLMKWQKSFIYSFSILFFLVMMSFSIFPLFFSGAASKSKYSSLGSFRGVAQVISYEVKMVLLMLFPILFSCSFSSYWVLEKFSLSWVMFPFILMFWMFSIMAETNRSPFDFAEGESELVSGFNTEYSGLSFTLLFLGEYSNIIMMSMVSSLFFFNKSVFFSLFFIYLFISFRATFPRFRYDLLMMYSWKVILIMLLFSFFFQIFLVLL